MKMGTVETVLGWVEWLVLVLIGLEIVIAGWKVASEHNIGEGFRKLILATAGAVLILAFVNYFVPQVPSAIPSAVLSLPGAQYLVDLAVASFAIGAIYGGYLVAKGDLERGFEMLGLVAVMFVLMSSASSLFGSSSLPLNVQLNNITANANKGGISLNFLGDMIYFATVLPSPSNSPAMGDLFNLVNQYATAVAVIGLIILVVWRFLFDNEIELMGYLVSIVKDIAIVAILISGALDIWAGFSEIVNGLTAAILDSSQVQTFLNQMVLVIIGWVAGALASGYFVPFVADFVAGLLEMSVFAFDLSLARYLLISAVVALAPVLAGLWLWPPLRKVVNFLAEFVLGMAVGGLIASGAIYILSDSGWLTGLALAFAPLVLGVVPWATGIAFGGVGSAGGGIFSMPKGSSSASQGQPSGSTTLQSTKQQSVPQQTTLYKPTTQQVPQPTQAQGSGASSWLPPTVQRVLNRGTIQTQAPIGQVGSSVPSGYSAQVQMPNVGAPSRAYQSVTLGSTGYGTGLRLLPKNASLGTVVSQGRVGGNNIAGASSSAVANVVARETRLHALGEALKNNAVLFLRQFDASLQRRLGISSGSVRPSYSTSLRKASVKVKP
jgi:hypothetical protein